MAKKTFILYDGRAKDGNTDDASVLVVASSEREAKRDGKMNWQGYDAIWFEYDLTHDNYLINGKARWDLPPCGPKRKRRRKA